LKQISPNIVAAMSKTTPKLLLVQNDSAAAKMLAPGGFELTPAEHLAGALEKIKSSSFDLVVMDLVLPDGHGLSAFHRIYSALTHTPVVVLADELDEEIAARTLWVGAQDYLLKPQLTAPVLINTVRKALARHYCQLTHNHELFLLQTLMNSISDTVYFKDTGSRFLMVNRAQAKRLGLTDPQQAVGKSDADFFSSPHACQALADELAIMRTGQPMEGIEESETWPDGSVTWVSTTKMPLRNQAGRIIGTYGISREITKRKVAELALAEKTAQLHKKNQQIEDELKMARELQIAMLPQNFPAVSPDFTETEGLKFFSFYIPSGAVSGDFFDVVPISKTAVGIFICDVMGHDVRAALVTAMLRALVEDFSLKAADPGELLAEINRALFKVFRQAGTTMFATAFYLVADVAKGQLTYASAAHPNPLLLQRREHQVEVLGPDVGGKKGPALGLFRDSKFPTCRRPMHEEDVVVLYTDGMIEEEGPNKEIFSQERLAETIRQLAALPTKELLGKTLEEIRKFSGQPEFSDDVCLLGVEVQRLKSA
jgi:sigma-B regulation protein RsbU (phosphoserine phosphatase)